MRRNIIHDAHSKANPMTTFNISFFHSVKLFSWSLIAQVIIIIHATTITTNENISITVTNILLMAHISLGNALSALTLVVLPADVSLLNSIQSQINGITVFNWTQQHHWEESQTHFQPSSFWPGGHTQLFQSRIFDHGHSQTWSGGVHVQQASGPVGIQPSGHLHSHSIIDFGGGQGCSGIQHLPYTKLCHGKWSHDHVNADTEGLLHLQHDLLSDSNHSGQVQSGFGFSSASAQRHCAIWDIVLFQNLPSSQVELQLSLEFNQAK